MSISYGEQGHSGLSTSLAPHSAPGTGSHLALVCWSGPLDATASTGFLQRARMLCRNCACVIADLTGIDFLDSDGVRALLLLKEEMAVAGRELRLVVPPGTRAARTLTLLQLMERLQVYSTVAEASAPRTQPA